jgi:uncharacterized protein (TIGR03067 family)
MHRLPPCLLLFVLTAVAVAVPAPAEKKADESWSIDGTYGILNVEDGQRGAPEAEELAKMALARVKFEKNKMTMSMPNEPTMTASVVLDYAKSPATIDISPDEGPEKGKTIRGICKREGPVLTICATQHGNAARPTEFKAAKGIVILTFKLTK